jgi:NAD(P)H-hydrate epimerase
LIAARYLKEYGYEVSILYPKKTENEIYLKLLLQCRNYGIEIIEDFKSTNILDYELIIDGIFGFSFSGEIREPFKTILNVIKS